MIINDNKQKETLDKRIVVWHKSASDEGALAMMCVRKKNDIHSPRHHERHITT